MQSADGSWAWRYDRGGRGGARDGGLEGGLDDEVDQTAAQMSPLWDDFDRISCPITLVRGSLSPVVDDDDVAECRRRQPGVRVETIDGAGHSIQGDRPLELAALIADVLGDR
ncbi:MAG: alpha/beta hydrolase [Actinobacteria bacterium]|nr:alpha/beta hydrolase [Actinomycetota bacterium]